MTKTKIFISHSDEDRTWVRTFARALEEEGAAVWLDEQELHAGDVLPAALERALRGSDLVAFVVTRENAQRPTLLFELGAAIALGKRVVAIVPRDFDAHALPFPRRIRQFLHRESPEATAGQLLAATAA